MRRRIEFLLLPIVIVPCAAIVGLSLAPSAYESSSVVLYKDSLPFAGDMEKMLVQKPEYRSPDVDRLAQIQARLKGRVFLEEVAQRLNMGLSPEAVEGLETSLPAGVSIEEFKTRVIVESLRKRIRVEEIGQDLFRISVTHPNGGTAYMLADGITRSFVDYVTRGQLAYIRAAGSFSEDQLPVYEEKLKRSEDALRKLRAEVASREGSLDARSVERARTLLREADVEITDLEAQTAGLRDDMRKRFPNEVDPTTLVRTSGIKSAYAQMEREEQQGVPLLVEGTGGGSIAERVGGAREILHSRIQEATRNTLKGSPEALQSLVAEVIYAEQVLKSLKVRRNAISVVLASHNRSLGKKPQDEVELKKLEEEVVNNTAVLQSLRAQLTSSRISEAAQATNLGVRIEIVEPPARPLTPAGPKRERILVLAFILGPFLGISFVVISEYMDDTVKSVHDLTRGLGLEVLGTIPRMTGTEFRESLRRKKWAYAAMLAVVLATAGVHLGREPLMGLLGRDGQGMETSAPQGTQERVIGE